MLPTIVLFCAFISSILWLNAVIKDTVEGILEKVSHEFLTNLIWGIIASIFWAWLFYLMH